MKTQFGSDVRGLIDRLAGNHTKPTPSVRKKVIFYEKLPTEDIHMLKGRLVFEDHSEVFFFADSWNKPELNQRVHLDWTDGNLFAVIHERSIDLHGSRAQIDKFNTVVRY